MKHTQDEWHAVDYAGHWAIQDTPYYDTGKDLLNVEAVGAESALANAKLMAAAPDLLEALHDLLSVAPDLPDTWETQFDKSLRDVIIKSQAAIKKAIT